VITAFSEAALESIGVSNMRDYAQLVPNMFMVETQNSSFTFVNIRSISQMRNTDPSVAVVIDGVQQTNAIGMSQELYDIQQIEILKGPQGALYGRNSIGGAISITTKRPGNESEGFVRLGAGNGESYKLQGALVGALIEDKLFGRIAFSYSDSQGVRKNVATGG
jgi:iron complex outermembrane recepter protein